MVALQIKYYINWLQLKNYKSFYLAFLRVAISIWLLKDVLINWTSLDILYGPSGFTVPPSKLFFSITGEVYALIRHNYHWFVACYLAVICLNILGIGRWFTALLLFVSTWVLHHLNTSFINGGDRMAELILMYLIIADTYQYFVLQKQRFEKVDEAKLKNLLSNLAAVSIMLQLCVIYFSLGLSKINDALWWQGEAVYYALLMERFEGTSLNKVIVQYKWLVVAANYAVMIFELLFPLLVWIKKLRRRLILAGIIFHACIYVFMMIYGFQIVFVLVYGLFLPNKTPVGWYEDIGRKLKWPTFRRSNVI